MKGHIMKTGIMIAAWLLLMNFASAQDRSRYMPGNNDQHNTYSSYQTPQKGFSPSKIFVGGDLGFAFGNYTYINVSPLAGYRFSHFFAAGININFNFASQKDYYSTQSQNYTILGAGVFTRIYPLHWLYLQVQPEYNQYTARLKDNGSVLEKQTHDVMSLLMGGGYAQQVSDRAEITFGIMYDVLQNPYSPYYGIPVIQGGFNVDL